MSGATGAIIGAGVAAAGASVYAANKSSSAMQSASRAANSEQGREFDLAYNAQAPYRQVGGEALNQLASLYGLPQYQDPSMPATSAAPDYSAFYNSPDYAFARDQGIKAVTQNAALAGGLRSGNALRGVTDFASGLASQNFNNYANRLAALAGIGQNSAINTGNQAITTGQGIATNLINAGNARASGIQNSAAGFNNALQGGLSNYLYLQRQNQYPQNYYTGGGNMYTAPDGYTITY